MIEISVVLKFSLLLGQLKLATMLEEVQRKSSVDPTLPCISLLVQFQELMHLWQRITGFWHCTPQFLPNSQHFFIEVWRHTHNLSSHCTKSTNELYLLELSTPFVNELLMNASVRWLKPETTWEGGLNTFTEWRFNRETRQLQNHVHDSKMIFTCLRTTLKWF